MIIIYTLLAAKNEENRHDAIPVFGISVLGYAKNSNGEKSNKAPQKSLSDTLKIAEVVVTA